MPFSKLYLLEIIDSETVTTKTPAQLVNETASPFFIGFIISAAYVRYCVHYIIIPESRV
jgi:hypothetical protein